ncbi:NUDIX hydrolase [Sciscionella marina]|uniref:NUDIX hydrolase n=1 Tax=Sciscionella marina TaxID=508770 RepID=UPI000382D196|nr:NUDIX domain-containing protein [Sciscionella marina]
MTEEQVALFTEDGLPDGSAPRSVMRARKLWHAATFVLPRSVDGTRIYVHQRTFTKDVFPGLFDCWAGGVLAAGESVAEGARRELAEELGVRGVALEPLFGFRFEPTRCHCHCFEARTDGPFIWQPEEVADGGWRTLPELRAMLEDPATPFVTDGRAALERWLSLRKAAP